VAEACLRKENPGVSAGALQVGKDDALTFSIGTIDTRGDVFVPVQAPGSSADRSRTPPEERTPLVS